VEKIKLHGGIQLTGFNKDKAIMTTQIKVSDLLRVYRIDPSVNRDLNYNRLPKLTEYINSFDLEQGIYLPAIVCSLRESPTKYYNKEDRTLEVPFGVKLVVLDGQHRIKSLERFLGNNSIDNERKKVISNSQLTLQLYFNLSQQDERVLFSDINSHSKKVSMSLVTKYDTREIMNELVSDLYNVSQPLQSLQIEFEKSRLVRPGNRSLFTSVRLIRFLNHLLFGKREINQQEKKIIKDNYDDVLSFLDKFFLNYTEVLPSEPGNVLNYVLGHEPLQNAIGLYLNKTIITNEDGKVQGVENWEREVLKLKNVNWSVNWEGWQSYMYSSRPNTPNEYLAFIERSDKKLLNVLEDHLNTVSIS